MLARTLKLIVRLPFLILSAPFMLIWFLLFSVEFFIYWAFNKKSSINEEGVKDIFICWWACWKI